MKKICTHCNEEKLILDFSYCNKKGGYTNVCKKCKNERLNTENRKIRKAIGKQPGYNNFQIN